jgi:hypothetical protein
METQFSTTFIPKKPVVTPEPSANMPVSRPLGFLSVVAWIIFAVSLVGAGAAYAYKTYTQKQNTDLAQSVARVEKNFEPTLLTELLRLDKKLTVANQLLRSHRSMSPFFDFLEASTLPSVRYSKIDFSFADDGTPKITLSGEGDSYRSIAQQSRIWSENQYIKNHIFSNFVLTSKGRIAYDLVFYVAPDVFSYGSNRNLSVPSGSSLPTLGGLESIQPSTMETSPVDDTQSPTPGLVAPAPAQSSGGGKGAAPAPKTN